MVFVWGPNNLPHREEDLKWSFDLAWGSAKVSVAHDLLAASLQPFTSLQTGSMLGWWFTFGTYAPPGTLGCLCVSLLLQISLCHGLTNLFLEFKDALLGSDSK